MNSSFNKFLYIGFYY